MTTATLHLHHKIDKLTVVESFLSGLVAFAQALPWILALAFLGTFGFIASILLWMVLVFARWRLNRMNSQIRLKIHDMDMNAIMDLHLTSEELGKILAHLKSVSSKDSIFRPIHRVADQMFSDNKSFEQLLFSKAYPEYETPLTEEQKKELFEATQAWRDDERENNERY